MPVKPSTKEEEYIAKLEAEKLKKIAEERERNLAQKQKEELKQLHWMRCPKCGMELQTIKYQTIEIDRCFSCNGTWLDEGELEKVAGAEQEHRGALASLLKIFK
jgi:protein-arginine kinase activator protein McsA